MKTEYISGTIAKQADRYAIDVLGIPSLTLMERASSYVAEYVVNTYPEAQVAILCGTGNNGADGICIARMLKEKGYEPVAITCGNAWKGTWEFLHQLSEYVRIGGSVLAYGQEANDALMRESVQKADVIIDALFGIGLKRPVSGGFAKLIENANSTDAHKVAVDIPSGIHADTGEKMGTAFLAEKTFTFGKNKTGLVTGDGKEAAGQVAVCDIGIPEEVYEMLCRAG